jgi:hypothetical protein
MKSRLQAKSLALWLCACALVCAPFGSEAAAAQQPARRSARETESLRRSFLEVFGKDFEFVKDKLLRRSTFNSGGVFWLVHAKPKRSGHYTVKYRYRYVDSVRPQDPLYEFVEHEIPIWVGEKGCRRRVQDRNYTDVCLGDTVVIPFVFDNYSEHTFSLAVREYEPETDAHKKVSAMEMERRPETDKLLYTEPVANPAREFLKYVGSSSQVRPHRSPGYTMSFYATFEALKPGSFNLSLGVRVDSSLPLGLSSGGSVPVIVVERGAPVTMLASGEYVRSWRDRFSSGTGNSYLTTPLVMQPGDRITLQYHGFSVRDLRGEGTGRVKPDDALKGAAPVINLLPFYVDPEQGFNQLIVEHLPVRSPSKAP